MMVSDKLNENYDFKKIDHFCFRQIMIVGHSVGGSVAETLAKDFFSEVSIYNIMTHVD